MTSSIKSVRGISANLPDQSDAFRYIETQCAKVLESCGYREIRLPVLEHTELFKRSIGDATDIVQKEMFCFEDRRGDLLTLRPEGTAGCAKAAIDNNLLGAGSPCRLWYGGLFFRRERPQKGRRRQFHQIGVEAFAMPGPAADVEVLALTQQFWQALGISSLQLKINNLGDAKTQSAYAAALRQWLEPKAAQLDEDCKRRLDTNPLRILDSKNPEMQALLQDAPQIADHCDAASTEHFAAVTQSLDALGIAYQLDPLLVRGLDYYTGMVFEWIDPQGGGQSTVCAGGRYDTLVERLGGHKDASYAVGCALGVERLALVSDIALPQPPKTDVYFVVLEGASTAQQLAFNLRSNMPGMTVIVDAKGGSLKSQMGRADKSGAEIAVVLGPDEIAQGLVSVKPLRKDGDQQSFPQAELCAEIKKYLQ